MFSSFQHHKVFKKIQNHFYNSLYYFGTISQKRGHLIEGDCFIGSHNANLGY